MTTQAQADEIREALAWQFAAHEGMDTLGEGLAV